MNTRNESVVLSFLHSLHSSEQPDFNAAVLAFAEDARYQVCVPRGPLLTGRAEIAANLTGQFAYYHDCDCEILAVAANGRHVFTERRDHVTITHLDKRIFSSVCAVFDVDDRGLISGWREYWDTDDINQQLGLTPEEAAALHGGQG
jgi:limonene-1,2-epoxide hydrolase